MKRFEHPAKKMFGKLTDLKAEHDVNESMAGGRHMRAHSELHRILGSKTGSLVDQLEHEHALLADMPVIRKYVQNRCENPRLPASATWRWAKNVVVQNNEEPEGFNTDGRDFEVDGFDITVELESDDCPDYSFYGKFVDSWEPGAVRNPEAWTSHGNRNNHYIAYFVPAYSEEERFADLHKRGMDKQSARLEARQGVLKDIEYAREYSPMVAIVKAYKNGIELGSDVLGGLDYEDPDDAIFEHDMIDSAISEAKAAIAKLTEASK